MDERTSHNQLEEFLMMVYEEMISILRDFSIARLEHYLNKRDKAPDAGSFRLNGESTHPLIATIEKHNLDQFEQILLSIVMAPHFDPGFYSGVIQQVLPGGGDLPIFGCVKGKHHRGFIPTGETVLFIIGGADLEKRLEAVSLIKNSSLIKKHILSLEPVEPGEPEMSGKLVLSKEYAGLFFTGTHELPDFGPDFPAQKIETGLDWDDLVLPDNVAEQIEELKTWIHFNGRLMDEWEMRKKIKPGYRVLFSGPPGTGKTLTATLLGKYTGMPVFRVDLSTIVSKYIGETEKNLEKLFSRAENRDWILFFDEADALFGKRTDVSDSHDRYANQEVSYLLQRVESFSGLVILSTNYKSNLDEAFLRRFNCIIRFPFPDSEQRLKIWKKSFPVKVRFEEDVNLKEVANQYKLSGGNIINVVHWTSLKTISRDSNVITLENLLNGIQREMEKEGKIFNNMYEGEIRSNGKRRG